MIGAAWMPQIILFLGSRPVIRRPVAYLQDHWLDVPRFLAAGVAMAAYATTLAMLAASFTTRRAYASVFLVGLFVITTPFTVGLAQQIGGTAGQWVSMFNLTNIPVHVNDMIFGDASEMTEDAPARDARLDDTRELVLALDDRAGTRPVVALSEALSVTAVIPSDGEESPGGVIPSGARRKVESTGRRNTRR